MLLTARFTDAKGKHLTPENDVIETDDYKRIVRPVLVYLKNYNIEHDLGAVHVKVGFYKDGEKIRTEKVKLKSINSLKMT